MVKINTIFSVLDFPIGFQASKVLKKLFLPYENIELKGLQKLQLKNVYVCFRYASYLSVELVLIIEVIKELRPDHNASDEESKYRKADLWTLKEFIIKFYILSWYRSIYIRAATNTHSEQRAYLHIPPSKYSYFAGTHAPI